MAAPDVSPAPAGYQVVARRYRPQLFADLVGQEHVARGLSGAITSGRIGHAYLFTGARGVGKTSAARIFAKALECAAGPAAEPCNACDACTAIAAGQDVDVVEIDAASNRGIDEIRQLRQNVAVRPARGRFKVYIIDEVHMLTREAFNALLKTLEEPPGHVKFVLCTTEPDKLPITILSRCQRFDFVTVDAPAIARRLAQIVEAEGAEVSAEALNLIARRAAGSMRDSQSLLEQLLGSATGPIGVDDVHAVIGTGREERIGSLVAAIGNRDPAAAIAALDAALEGGADPGGVLEQVLAVLRDGLVASVGCGPERFLQASSAGVDPAAIGAALGTPTILAMLQILDQSLTRMRSSGHAHVLAEMAVVRLARLEDLESLAEAVDRVAAGAAARGPAAAAGAPVTPAVRPVVAVVPPRPTVAPMTGQGQPAQPAPPQPAAAATPAAREKKTTDAMTEPAAAAAEQPATVVDAGVGMPDEPASASAAGLPADPRAALLGGSATLGGLAVDFAGAARSVEWRDDVLVVNLPADATTAAAFLRRPEVTRGLTAALTEMAGRSIGYTIAVDAPAAGPAVTAAASPRTSTAVTQAARLKAAAEHPLVARARAVFDAAIRTVEPPRRAEEGAGSPVAAGRTAAPAATVTAEEDERDASVDDDAGGMLDG
jgi:DNA polymerase-3 subunit gamma/tau